MTLVTTLGELCGEVGVQTGPFGGQLHAHEYEPEGIPVVMPQDIGDNVIRTDSIARVPERVAQRLDRHRLREGDIVYSRRGDVERRALVRRNEANWLCGTGCLRVRLDAAAQADPRFVSYYLGLPETREWIVSHAVGGTMLNLNTGILAAVPIRLPELTEQFAIAEVLGTLDDKIAANARVQLLSSTLAETAFHRVQAAAVRRCSLREVVALEYGKALPATERRAGTVDVFGSGGAVGTHDEALCEGPGIVVGRKGTVGAVYWARRDFYPIDTVFYAKPLDCMTFEYAYFVLKSLPLGELNSDSAVPGLNRNEAYAQQTPMAAHDAIAQFTEDARVFFAQIEAAQDESRHLAELRDALLPHLMSGRITVRQAELLVEASG